MTEKGIQKRGRPVNVHAVFFAEILLPQKVFSEEVEAVLVDITGDDGCK